MSAPHEHEPCRVCKVDQCVINGEMVEHQGDGKRQRTTPGLTGFPLSPSLPW